MADKTTYYALIDEFSSAEEPGGVIRRVVGNEGTIDEAFSIDLKWEYSPLLAAAERGDTMFEFPQISEAEAMRIVERIKEVAASAE